MEAKCDFCGFFASKTYDVVCDNKQMIACDLCHDSEVFKLSEGARKNMSVICRIANNCVQKLMYNNPILLNDRQDGKGLLGSTREETVHIGKYEVMISGSSECKYCHAIIHWGQIPGRDKKSPINEDKKSFHNCRSQQNG